MGRMRKGMAGSLFAGFVLSVLVFLMTVTIVMFRSNLNSIIHNLRTEIYMIGKNSLFAIERDLLAEDIYSVYEADIEKFIKQEIITSWELDENLKKGQGLIEKAEILEVSVLNKGEFDNILNIRVPNMTIHIVVEVSVNPIILKSVFGDNMRFKLHEDVKIEKLGGA